MLAGLVRRTRKHFMGKPTGFLEFAKDGGHPGLELRRVGHVDNKRMHRRSPADRFLERIAAPPRNYHRGAARLERPREFAANPRTATGDRDDTRGRALAHRAPNGGECSEIIVGGRAAATRVRLYPSARLQAFRSPSSRMTLWTAGSRSIIL